MTQETDTTSEAQAAPPAQAPVKSPAVWPLYIVFLAGLAVPALFLYQTWFGVELSDARMVEYLHDTVKGRHVQHALEQMTHRMETDPEAAQKFYPDVIHASRHEEAAVRAMAAWTMGFDAEAEAFRVPLEEMLLDESIIVRYNAALSLSKFQDESALPVLRDMLRPLKITAPTGGKVTGLLDAGRRIDMNAQLAFLDDETLGRVSIKAPLKCEVGAVYVSEGAVVQEGEELMSLNPAWEQVWEALRAMYLLGGEEDLGDVRRYTTLLPDMPPALLTQAQLTEKEILRKTSQPLPVIGTIGAFSLTNFDGSEVTAERLRGTPWVATFIFTNCSGSCPVMTAQMWSLQKASAGGELRLVSFTCDPENDTPERLKEYAESMQADPARWFFVTGDKEAIYKISVEQFHLPLSEAGAEEVSRGAEAFLHSQRLALVDAAGRVRGVYDGLDEKAVAEILRDLKKLQAE